mgnify:FL=1
MENEIWKDVKGYEGYYQVSNMGRVKSMRVLKTPKNGVKCRKNTFLSTKTSHDKQYILVALCRDGERKQVQVHRLVAEAFIPNPKNLPFVNHKDENPSNNCADNLEWCTHEYNLQYSMERNGRTKGRETTTHPHNQAVPVVAYTFEGEIVARFDSVWEAAEKFKNKGVDGRGLRNRIRSCCSGKIPSTCGFIWKYEGNAKPKPYPYNRSKQTSGDGSFLQVLMNFLKYNGAVMVSPSDIKICAKGKVFDFGQVVSANEISKMIDAK